MPQSSELLAEVKAQQNVIITRAALSIPLQEMSGKEIDAAMMTQFLCHVANASHVPGAPKDAFLRSTRHLDATVSDKDMHNGTTLWRKFAAIKKYVNNQITPLYVKNLGPDGKPPSGHTKEQVILKTRRQLYDLEQEEAKSRSKNPAAFKKKPFYASWYPVEWEVFMLFGRASESPERHFFIK
jgi:hypothetical protein